MSTVWTQPAVNSRYSKPRVAAAPRWTSARFTCCVTTEVLDALVIRPEEPGKWLRPAALGRFAGAPPGRYRLRLALSEARASSLRIRSERQFRFDRHFPVPAEIRPEVTFDLPGGAGELTIFATEMLLPVVQTIDLTPIELSPGPSYLQARRPRPASRGVLSR